MTDAVKNAPSASRVQGAAAAGQRDVRAELKQLRVLSTEASGPKTNELTNQLQTTLVKNGLLKQDNFTAGDFDAATQAAVRKYQQQEGLKQDGVVGQQTWASLLGAKGVQPGVHMLADGGQPEKAPAGWAGGKPSPVAQPGKSGDAKPANVAPAQGGAPAAVAPTAPTAVSATGAPAESPAATTPADAAERQQILDEKGAAYTAPDGKPLTATQGEWDAGYRPVEVETPKGPTALLVPPGMTIDNGSHQLTLEQGHPVYFNEQGQRAGVLGDDGRPMTAGTTDTDMANSAATAQQLSQNDAAANPGAKGVQAAAALAGAKFVPARAAFKAAKAATAYNAAYTKAMGKSFAADEALGALAAAKTKGGRVGVATAKVKAFFANRSASSAEKAFNAAEKKGVSAFAQLQKVEGTTVLGRMKAGVSTLTKGGAKEGVEEAALGALKLAADTKAPVAQGLFNRAVAAFAKSFAGRIGSAVPIAGAVVSTAVTAMDGAHLYSVMKNDKPVGQQGLAAISTLASTASTVGQAAQVVPVLGTVVSSANSILWAVVGAAAATAETVLYDQ